MALNGDFRQDVDYAGTLVVQAGWQWRSHAGHVFRVGGRYFTGKGEQFQFLDQDEAKVGAGIWCDF